MGKRHCPFPTAMTFDGGFLRPRFFPLSQWPLAENYDNFDRVGNDKAPCYRLESEKVL
jgi:hypothetical protein